MVDLGVDMVVAEARVLYRSALRFDDEFEAQAEIARLGETSMTTEIQVIRGGESVAEGELRHVFIESGGDSTASIPEPIRTGLGRYEPADGT